jgi:hypothetical protein
MKDIFLVFCCILRQAPVYEVGCFKAAAAGFLLFEEDIPFVSIAKVKN